MQVERYWNEHQWPSGSTMTPKTPEANMSLSSKGLGNVKKAKGSHLVDYDRLHQECLVKNSKEPGKEGWQAELCCYLDNSFPDVKKDTDLIKLWQVCSVVQLKVLLRSTQDIGSEYPTMRQLALDTLPAQASSVPCE